MSNIMSNKLYIYIIYIYIIFIFFSYDFVMIIFKSIEWYIKIFHIFYHLENSEKILIYFQI